MSSRDEDDDDDGAGSPSRRLSGSLNEAIATHDAIVRDEHQLEEEQRRLQRIQEREAKLALEQERQRETFRLHHEQRMHQIDELERQRLAKQREAERALQERDDRKKRVAEERQLQEKIDKEWRDIEAAERERRRLLWEAGAEERAKQAEAERELQAKRDAQAREDAELQAQLADTDGEWRRLLHSDGFLAVVGGGDDDELGGSRPASAGTNRGSRSQTPGAKRLDRDRGGAVRTHKPVAAHMIRSSGYGYGALKDKAAQAAADAELQRHQKTGASQQALSSSRRGKGRRSRTRLDKFNDEQTRYVPFYEEEYPVPAQASQLFEPPFVPPDEAVDWHPRLRHKAAGRSRHGVESREPRLAGGFVESAVIEDTLAWRRGIARALKLAEERECEAERRERAEQERQRRELEDEEHEDKGGASDKQRQAVRPKTPQGLLRPIAPALENRGAGGDGDGVGDDGTSESSSTRAQPGAALTRALRSQERRKKAKLVNWNKHNVFVHRGPYQGMTRNPGNNPTAEERSGPHKHGNVVCHSHYCLRAFNLPESPWATDVRAYQRKVLEETRHKWLRGWWRDRWLAERSMLVRGGGEREAGAEADVDDMAAFEERKLKLQRQASAKEDESEKERERLRKEAEELRQRQLEEQKAPKSMREVLAAWAIEVDVENERLAKIRHAELQAEKERNILEAAKREEIRLIESRVREERLMEQRALEQQYADEQKALRLRREQKQERLRQARQLKREKLEKWQIEQEEKERRKLEEYMEHRHQLCEKLFAEIRDRYAQRQAEADLMQTIEEQHEQQKAKAPMLPLFTFNRASLNMKSIGGGGEDLATALARAAREEEERRAEEEGKKPTKLKSARATKMRREAKAKAKAAKLAAAQAAAEEAAKVEQEAAEAAKREAEAKAKAEQEAAKVAKREAKRKAAAEEAARRKAEEAAARDSALADMERIRQENLAAAAAVSGARLGAGESLPEIKRFDASLNAFQVSPAAVSPEKAAATSSAKKTKAKQDGSGKAAAPSSPVAVRAPASLAPAPPSQKVVRGSLSQLKKERTKSMSKRDDKQVVLLSNKTSPRTES